MSVARVVENVDERILKLCNAEEIQKFYGKLQNGDILHATKDTTIFPSGTCDSVYIWPHTTRLVNFQEQDYSTVEISLRDTILQKNAIVFFRPVFSLLRKKGRSLTLHLDKSDEGVAGFLGKGELSKKWRITLQESGTSHYWIFEHEGCVFGDHFMEISRFEKKIDFLREAEEEIYDAEMSYLLLVNAEVDRGKVCDILSSFTNVNKIYSICWNDGKKLVDIDGMLYKRHPEKNEKFLMVNMRVREKDRFEHYLKTEVPNAKLLVKTEPETILTEDKQRRPVQNDEVLLTSTGSRLNRWVVLRKKNRHVIMLDICLALAHLNMPYTIYFIVEKLRCFEYSNRFENVNFIEKVFQSIRKVWQQREEAAKKIKT